MRVVPYNRQAAVDYAREWAMARNPNYYDYHGIGGDCTNFISQCLYAGSGVMNFTPTMGWYYRTANDKAPAWTGVPYLYNFLVNNEGLGPFGHEAPLSDAQPGDVCQLSFNGEDWGHSLLVVEMAQQVNEETIRLATHSVDAFGRTLSSYFYAAVRLIHMDGVRVQ